jgi:hypothetical protein
VRRVNRDEQVLASSLSGVRTNGVDRDGQMRESPRELGHLAVAPHALFFEHLNPQ